MTATFEHHIPILFQHCDPAGIVFYPRYFEMVNETVETWCAEALGTSFAAMHLEQGYGVPTVSVTAEFPAPSRLGDVLTWRLQVKQLGHTSAHLTVDARAGDQQRMQAHPVLVCVDLGTGRPRPWPDTLRAAMTRFVGDEEGG